MEFHFRKNAAMKSAKPLGLSDVGLVDGMESERMKRTIRQDLSPGYTTRWISC